MANGAGDIACAKSWWLDSHPMAWTPDDLENSEGSDSTPSYVVQIDGRGATEVEWNLKSLESQPGLPSTAPVQSNKKQSSP